MTGPYVKQCSRKDPKLKKCLIDSLHHLRPYLRDGITEIKLPPIEPFRVSFTTKNPTYHLAFLSFFDSLHATSWLLAPQFLINFIKKTVSLSKYYSLTNFIDEQIEELILSLTGGPNGYKIQLQEMDVLGASNFTVNDITLGSPFEALIEMPALILNAHYSRLPFALSNSLLIYS